MKYFNFRLLTFILAFIFVTLMPAEGNITVFPLTIAVDSAPGATGSGAFFVRNTGENPDEVTITLADWSLDVNGNIQFLEPQSTDRSLAPYVQFAPVGFQLEPEQVQRVEFSYTLPPEQSGDHWLLFLVDSSEVTPIAETEGEVNTSVGVKVGFGVKVFQTDPTALQDGRVAGMRLEALDPLSIVVRFSNIADAVLRDVTGQVEIRDDQGDTVRTLEINPFTVLPGGVREVKVALEEGDTLPSGDYVALGIVDFGGDFLVAGELPFSVE